MQAAPNLPPMPPCDRSVAEFGDELVHDAHNPEETMRRLTEDARSLLIAAATVARFRGAQECDTSDIQVAALLIALHPGVALYADEEASTSPQQLPLAAHLEELLTGSTEELGFEELRRLAEGS